MINLERTGDPALETLKRAVNSRTRGLNQCLEEERRTSTKLKPARMTPIYTAANNANAGTALTAGTTAGGKITTAVKPSSAQKAGGKQAHFQAFDHPFVLIEEGDLYCAPIFKQYPPTVVREVVTRVTFPVIKWEGNPPHCPFSYTTRARPDGVYWSDLAGRDFSPMPIASPIEKDPHIAAVPVVPVAHAQNSTSKTVKNIPNKRASFGGDPAKRQSFHPKPKPGYCECCYEKYEALRPHVQSAKHRTFALIQENYASVDAIIARLDRQPLVDATYNPILAWGQVRLTMATSGGVTTHAHAHMSPAHSTILSQCTRKSAMSGLRAAHIPLPATLEDKENDSPSGLDLTGLDKGYLAEKRHVMSQESQPTSIMCAAASSEADVFENPAKRKMRRISAIKL